MLNTPVASDVRCSTIGDDVPRPPMIRGVLPSDWVCGCSSTGGSRVEGKYRQINREDVDGVFPIFPSGRHNIKELLRKTGATH